MSDKTPNYTPEMIERMKAVYSPDAPEAERSEAVATLAKELSKPTKSIVAKLVTMDLYRKAERKTKDGKPIVKKDEYADRIQVPLGGSTG